MTPTDAAQAGHEANCLNAPVNEKSSIFHMDQTKVMDGNFVRVMSWYDNEWGFSNRMADTAVAMGKLI